MAHSDEQFIVFGSPQIEQPEIDEVVATLRSGWLGTGPRVAEFEKRFAAYIGAEHAVALSSCTAALHLSLLLAGIGRSDEVITTPITFAATANVIVHAGAKPVFVDVDARTMNIAPDAVEAAVTERTRAILPVHLAGRPCNMSRLRQIAEKHSLIIIEDAAHAIEARCPAGKIGKISPATCFSFYVTKNICTGEGGMLTTDDAEWAEKARILSLHGLSKDAWQRYSKAPAGHYQALYPGYKYNMMDIQAAIGLHQLARISDNLKRREELWARYDEAFAGLPVICPAAAEPETVHARHLYSLLIDPVRCGITRDEFRKRLYDQGVGSGVHYLCLADQPFYSETYPTDAPLPNARRISEQTVSIPLSPKLTDGDAGRVIAAVRHAVSAGS